MACQMRIRTEWRGPYVTEYELERGTLLILVPEPSNPFDRNAVELRNITGSHRGYVAKEDSSLVAGLLLLGCPLLAKVTRPHIKSRFAPGAPWARVLIWCENSCAHQDKHTEVRRPERIDG